MGTLEIVAKASARDAVLLAKTMPAFSGSETEDLICGRCGQTIAAGVSARTLRRSHPEGNRLIVRCACKAYMSWPVRCRGAGPSGGKAADDRSASVHHAPRDALQP